MRQFLRRVFSLESIASDVRNVFVTLMTVGALSVIGGFLTAIIKSIRQEPIPWAILIGLVTLGIVLIAIAVILSARRAQSNFAAVTFEDAIIVANPDGTQRIIHKGTPDNTDQKVAQWVETRFPRRVVLMDDRYHFGFEVQVPPGRRVMIRRMKNRPECITILNRIAMTDEQRTKLKEMSDQARDSLLRTINLEASRSKIEPHFDQDFRYACLHHDILITSELTESRLMDGINNVKFAHSVIHHTINNLLKPPNTVTTASEARVDDVIRLPLTGLRLRKECDKWIEGAKAIHQRLVESGQKEQAIKDAQKWLDDFEKFAELNFSDPLSDYDKLTYFRKFLGANAPDAGDPVYQYQRALSYCFGHLVILRDKIK
jgi:hypothetical protein